MIIINNYYCYTCTMKPVKLTYIYAKNYVTVEIDLMDVTQALEPMHLRVDIDNFITFLYFLS